MNWKIFFTLLTAFIITPNLKAQDLSYDDLVSELNYKRNRLSKINSGDSLSQRSVSLGVVTTLNEIDAPSSVQHPWLQGFEIGLNTDLGSKDIEGRSLFRYFFENQRSADRTSLREIAFQIAKAQSYNRGWDWTYGGGFSLRHLLHESSLSTINEVSIQLNALVGLETRLSSTSKIAFEAGSRFPFGVSGRDRFSFDTAIKLTTEIE